MTMNNPVVPRANDERQTRPERMFEPRRAVGIVLLILPVVCLVFFIMRGCANPFGGTEKVIAAGPKQVATVTAVPVVLPLPSTAVRPGAPVAGIVCSMLSDVSFVSGVLPVSARVLVNGYTFAEGGRVYIADPNAGWQNAGLVRCDGDLRSLERSYFIPATSTAFPSPTVHVTSTPRVVVVNGPTYTPYPTYTPAPFTSSAGLGVHRESGDCWRFDISGIREIRVNRGDPVAGGALVCGVKSFTVVVE